MIAPETRRLVRAALREDLGRLGDVTTRFFVPASARVEGRVIAKAPGVLSGLDVALAVFREVGGCRCAALARDGARLKAGQAVLRVRGDRRVLTAERVALNFLQRLSGVATLTARFVDAVKGTGAAILDTRKTTPGWRLLEKRAVACGGGQNHRFGLYDAVLVKDNHWAYGRGEVPSSARAVRRRHPGLPVEIEAASLEQVGRALQAAPDIVLLDNMSPLMLKRAIRLIRASAPRTLIEVSGMVSLDNVRRIAELGCDRISIGRLTHSAPALDLSLETR